MSNSEQPVGKSKALASLLAFLLGGLGFHELYLGRYNRAAFYMLLAWTGLPIIAGIIQGLKYYREPQEDFDERIRAIKRAKRKRVKPEKIK